MDRGYYGANPQSFRRRTASACTSLGLFYPAGDFFIERASSRKCRFTLAHMRSYALETKERMLMYLHALERLNRMFLLSEYNVLVEYGLNNYVCGFSIIVFGDHVC